MMLARLQQALDQADTAASTMREVRQAALRFNLPPLDAHIAAVEAEILLRQGNLAAAEGWAETAGLSYTDTPHHLRESEYVTYARLLLAQDKPAQAFTLLEKLEQSALAGGRARSVITIHILQALAHHALGHEAQAHTTLAAALQLAAPENYVRAFLDEDPRLLKLLPKMRQLAPDFVDRVLQGDQDQAGPPAPAPVKQALAESLSERELEVLQLIAAGLSNHEIADRLIIGVGTVKSHVHSILGKLDARDRAQAVARAREYKLL
jgi:LuxR family maltose regulon positive regulatory protein